MANNSTRTPMREQAPQERAKNFEEVALGYNKEEALREASRCLNCKNPRCMQGCPVGVPIPKFIQKLKEGNTDAALEVIKTANSLPAVCGRVCPQEGQCEKYCVLGVKGEPVAIGRLERFAADNAQTCESGPVTENGHKVAIVGAGPAGLTCAGTLRKMGYAVTVFEVLHKPGGVLVYGIPEFRLPKRIVDAEVGQLKDMGVQIELNTVVGKTITVDELFEEGFEAVFIGSGAGLPRFMNIPGENLPGVYSANEYLTRINLMKAYLEESHTPITRAECVAVVGGGNVAMDAARCALRMGAKEVHLVYRRSLEEMPARAEEVHHAMEEGVIFDMLTNPVEIIGEDGKCAKLRCVKMQLGEPDASGRRSPVVVEGSEFEMRCDLAIMAIGTSPNPLLRSTTPGLETQRWGGIVVNEDTMQTSREGVYAGGDAVSGAATVILAMGAGKKAASAIDAYIQSK